MAAQYLPMNGEARMVDCSNLYAFRAFEDYISLLRNRTSFNETYLDECKVPICGALWGYGVPDVSGIGASVGYLLATIIGPLLSILLLLTISTSPPHLYTRIATWILNRLPPKIRTLLPTASKFRAILTAGLTAFFESAIYFALAIEIATIAILAPKDYESQTLSFGDYDSRTCSLVSTICLLPLLYPVAILSFLGSPPPQQDNEPNQTANKSRRSTDNQIHHKQPYRLTLFSIAVLISLYPFLSQSFRTWAPSQIGEGKGDGGATYVTVEEWRPVESLCFDLDTAAGEVATLTATEHVVLGTFQMVASCVVVLFAVGMLIPGSLRRLEGWFCDDNDGGSENTDGGETASAARDTNTSVG